MSVDSTTSDWPVLDELVDRVLLARRAVAAAQAEEAMALAQAVEIVTDRAELLRQQAMDAGRTPRLSDADLPLREVSLELGFAMRVSDRTVQGRIGNAFALTRSFARTFDAWHAGEIDAGHAWAISHHGIGMPDAERARYEELCLTAAATESPARMTQAAKAIAAAVCPDLFADRTRAAAEERQVRLYELGDGLSRIIADLPAALAHAIVDRLTQAATAARDLECPTDAAESEPAESPTASAPPAAGERLVTGAKEHATRSHSCGCPARTLDQIRADVFCELLLTGTPHANLPEELAATITARIQVTIPVLTLAGDDSAGPALLAGFGPIDPDMARRLAGLAPGWDRVFLDADSGEPLAVDRYRVSAHLRRYLTARDERCRTPTCTRVVHGCDVDHTVDAARGGPTDVHNLAHLCRRHHVNKHHTGFRVRQIGHGVLEWTTPTGRRYLDRPPASVRFVAASDSPEPAPF